MSRIYFFIFGSYFFFLKAIAPPSLPCYTYTGLCEFLLAKIQEKGRKMQMKSGDDTDPSTYDISMGQGFVNFYQSFLLIG